MKIQMTKGQVRVLGSSLKEYRVRNWDDEEEDEIVGSLLTLLDKVVEIKTPEIRTRKQKHTKPNQPH